MSDRTPPRSGRPGGPEEGTPEYDWLYGTTGRRGGADDATEVIAAQPRPRAEPGAEPGAAGYERPDATKVIPAVPRSGPAGPVTPSRQPYQQPPPPPSRPAGPTGPAGASPARRRRGPRPRLRWLLYLLVLWLVFLVVVPLWAWQKVSQVDATPGGERPAEQPGTTYLLVGSDSRSNDVRGSRTDSIMLLHTGSGPNLLMSIPRDSIVAIPGHGDSEKINAAFAYGGPRLLVRTIEQNTGIRVDHYAEIGFTGLIDVVDAVGGVTICPTQRMVDPLAQLNIKKGCQEVGGKTALAYSRSRHVSGLGDIDRARHQREVVSAIGRKALSPWSFLNPFRYWRLSFAAADSIRVGDDTGPVSTARMFLALTRVTGDSGKTCGVPISDLAVTWDAERSKQLFDRIIADQTDDIPRSLCTPSGLPRGVTG